MPINIPLIEAKEPITDSVLREFEEREHLTFPRGYREFLTQIANGGAPAEELWFTISEISDAGQLHALLGVNRTDHLDLLSYNTRGAASLFFPNWVCIGYDSTSGAILVRNEPGDESIYYVESLPESDTKSFKLKIASSFESLCENLLTGEQIDEHLRNGL